MKEEVSLVVTWHRRGNYMCNYCLSTNKDTLEVACKGIRGDVTWFCDDCFRQMYKAAAIAKLGGEV